MATFTVRYTQSDNATDPGEITFKIGNDAPQTKTASGRLDNVSDFVTAGEFSAAGHDVTIECVRTSKHRMQIRLIFSGMSGGSYEYESGVREKILHDVPIDFH